MKRDLPRWPARSEADNLDMFYWLQAQLDQMLFEEIDQTNKYWFAKDDLSYFIASAESGNIGLLRTALAKDDPRIAKFVNLPKQSTRRRWQSPRWPYGGNRIHCAAEDVVRIRALWQQHFKKKKRISSTDLSAVDFAAKRWGVDPNKVAARMKKIKR
jgi:hypothetical protein